MLHVSPAFVNICCRWQVVVRRVNQLMGFCAKSSKLGSGEKPYLFLKSLNVQQSVSLLSSTSSQCNTLSTSLQHLVSLFARLANDNIGYIDWDPYIPKVCCLHFFPPPITQFSTPFEIRGTGYHVQCDLCNFGSWCMFHGHCCSSEKQTIKFPCLSSFCLWLTRSDLHHGCISAE